MSLKISTIVLYGATTLSMMTLSIATPSMIKNTTRSTNDTHHNDIMVVMSFIVLSVVAPSSVTIKKDFIR
jgi:hypothetical protein